MRTVRLLVLACITLLATRGWPGDRPFIDTDDWDTRQDIEEAAPWKEGGFELPSYPEEGDLVEFRVDDPRHGFRYFLDGRNLAVGEDGVVRYTLVIRSGKGADNVSVEGMRCDQGEVRTYAYGGARHRLHPLEASTWERIRLNGPYRYHLALRDLYLCDRNKFQSLEPSEILHRLQSAVRYRQTDGLF